MWLPHTTVALVIEHDGKYLLVKEKRNGKIVLNQPAGHIEEDENFIEACKRETLEETGWEIEVTDHLGVGIYKAPANGITYIRHSFIGRAIAFNQHAVLDEGIISAEWYSYDEIKTLKKQLRSPRVLTDIERYRNNIRIPLELAGYKEPS